MGCKRLNTSGYHPQCNGMDERFMRTLKDMLACYINDHLDNWDKFLPLVLFAYRTSPHQATGISPFELLYGRKPRLPLDANLFDREIDALSSTSDYLRSLRNIIRDLQQKAHLSIEKRQKTPSRTDGTTKHVYDCGSQVLLRTTPIALLPRGRKLQPRWDGPYLVWAQTSPVN